jgi:DNA-binding Lrp family transcriptional regulator
LSNGNHEQGVGGRTWTFLTNHARVLIYLARHPTRRIRDVADEIGITERAAQLIIADLEEAHYLTRTRVGRRNTYAINPNRPFRHPAEGDHLVQELISVFVGHDLRQTDQTGQTGQASPP